MVLKFLQLPYHLCEKVTALKVIVSRPFNCRHVFGALDHAGSLHCVSVIPQGNIPLVNGTCPYTL